MSGRTSQDQRSHVELITVYEICRILCASLDIDRTFRTALNVLTPLSRRTIGLRIATGCGAITTNE